jgi:hypothetical protein
MRLSLELLETRALLTTTAIVDNFSGSQYVGVRATANTDVKPLIASSTNLPLGNTISLSRIAGAGNATANIGSSFASTASTANPSLSIGGSVAGYTSATDGFSFVGGIPAEGWDDISNFTQIAEYEADCDGTLTLTFSLYVSISAHTDTRESGIASASVGNDFSITASVGSSTVGYINGSVSAISQSLGENDFPETHITVNSGDANGAFPSITSDRFTNPASTVVKLTFSISAAVSEGQSITLSGSHATHMYNQSQAPVSGTSIANSDVFSYVSIEGDVTCSPDPPPVPPPLEVWWGPGEGGGWWEPGPPGSPGDINKDGVIDELDRDEWQSLVEASASSPAPVYFMVSTEEDLDDGKYGIGQLSLREALKLAELQSGEDLIIFAPWVKNIELNGTQLDVDSDVNIAAPGSGALTIDAGGASRVFSVDAGVDATISGLTATGGGNVSAGGGILNNGDLTLNAVVVSGNTTTANGIGGGIRSTTYSRLEVINSTVDGNHASYGAGIYANVVDELLRIEGSTISNNVAPGIATSTYSEGGGLAIAGSATGTVEIVNSTFSGNEALFSGGIRLQNNLAPTTITNSTIAYNFGNDSGGIHRLNNTSAPVIHNTIVAENKNHAGARIDVAGALDAASSYNIFGAGRGSAALSGSGNQVGAALSPVDPLLAPLGDYGGKTKTHALKSNSPAIDKGSDDYALTYDQRGIGFTREYDLPDGTYPDADGYRDIGAYEAGVDTTLIVRSDGDRNNSVDLLATTDSLRLREAIALSNALAGGETILFDPTLYASGPAEITLTYDGPDGGSAPDRLSIGSSDLAIQGPGADRLTISGDNLTQIFYANSALGSGTALSISGLTLTEGNAGGGGAIYVKWADLTLDSVRIVGNSATFGGGIASEDVYQLKIINSEISENTAYAAGGGIFDTRYGLEEAPGLQIINSTISTNTVTYSGGQGGGLYSWRDDDSSLVALTIVNSTIAANTAATGGGIYSETVTGDDYIQLLNSIVADNVDLLNAPSDIEGLDIAFGMYNLIGLGGSGGLSDNVAGNLVLNGLESARLMPLDFYGGPTRTHALKYDSPAAEAGDSGIASLWDLDFDQRGFERDVDNTYAFGDNVDIGAFELAVDDYFS